MTVSHILTSRWRCMTLCLPRARERVEELLRWVASNRASARRYPMNSPAAKRHIAFRGAGCGNRNYISTSRFAALDAQSARISHLLRRLCRPAQPSAYIFVSHDLAL